MKIDQETHQWMTTQVEEGRYETEDHLMLTALHLLKQEEGKKNELQAAIKKGLDSGIAEGFDPQAHLAALHQQKRAHRG